MRMSTMQWAGFRHADAFWPSVALLSYIALGYLMGLLLLIQSHPLLWLAGIALTGHVLIVSAYLIHDLTHHTLFRTPAWNNRLGMVLGFITGACYGSYQDLRRKHMRHHVQRADVVAVDYKAWLEKHPALRRVVEALEWCYIPAVDLMMHALVMVAPFVYPQYRGLRRNAVTMFIVRSLLFTGLFLLSPWALVGYAASYMLMIHVLRLMDMHQHTYDVVYGSLEGHARPDAEYERQNTYSNPLGSSPLLNLLVLNFGYHNAHHEQPTAPWYRLPAIHRELYGEQSDHQFDARAVLNNLHKYRVQRVMSDAPLPGEQPGFTGLYGVSFLTTL